MSRITRRTAYAGACAAAVMLAGPSAHAVTGGDPTADTTDTFVVKLRIGDIRSCTGVLIAPRWLLTSASCFADGTSPVTAGVPPMPTTATVGRTDLSQGGGEVSTVIRLVPRADRDLTLAELADAVSDVTPVSIAGTGPSDGETVRAAGYGRTATEWAPNQLHTTVFTVRSSDATTVAINGATDDATLCKGDAGGPLLREAGGGTSLLALSTASWQHGCLGADPAETRRGATGTRVDDLTGWVAAAMAPGFGVPTQWSAVVFFGAKATLAGDVNGDGRTDLIAVNGPDTWVTLSQGSGFGTPILWSGTNFSGAKATLAGDVNGDGRTDLIAVNGPDTWVTLSQGSGFGTPILWSGTNFSGAKATLAGDVNGDGRTDLIAANGPDTWVALSQGTGFATPTRWSGTNFFGTQVTLAADVDGDRRADLVAVNADSTWVEPSGGTSFGPPAAWSSATFAGSQTTLAGDVNGDHVSDLVAVNDGGVSVMLG